jgi:Flp pilus assembly protein TadG
MSPLARVIKVLRDQRGVAAVEFAFIAPVMIVFYFGMVEACQILIADRKVVRATAAIGDLVAQAGSTITLSGSGGVSDILAMGDTLMTPFTTGANLKLCLASITANAANTAKTVDWSRSTNGATCPAKGATYTGVPAALIGGGQSVIMSSVSYTYTGSLAYVIHTTPTLSKTGYYKPRKVTTISCPTC